MAGEIREWEAGVIVLAVGVGLLSRGDIATGRSVGESPGLPVNESLCRKYLS